MQSSFREIGMHEPSNNVPRDLNAGGSRMKRKSVWIGLCALSFGSHAGGQIAGTSYTARFVDVQPNVRLEVLDWGGTGRPVILLAGMGQDAHVFDRFASTLASEYHVYAITRRGRGRSSAPDTIYPADRLGDDVLAVMDSLSIVRPVLVGHSMGGVELSSIGSRFPRRVAGLVYLDAAYLYAFVDPAREDPFQLPPPLCPCTVSQRYNAGFRAFRQISAPALAIFALGADSATKLGLGDWDWTPALQAKEFERDVPAARVLRIPGADHFVFRSNESDVLAAMREFISSLPK
jgi:pimeloyl-ACP methyl ester carboxylesterase